MNQEQIRKYFESSKLGPAPEMPAFDLELNAAGKPLGVGRVYSFLLRISISINAILLTIFLGIAFFSILYRSPLFRIVGHISAFAVLAVMQIVTLLLWIVSGIKGPMLYIYAQFWFGGRYFQSICSLIPFSLIFLFIILRTLKDIYISKRAALFLLSANCIMPMLLILRFGEYFHFLFRILQSIYFHLIYAR